jgi:hypothetical protein
MRSSLPPAPSGQMGSVLPILSQAPYRAAPRLCGPDTIRAAPSGLEWTALVGQSCRLGVRFRFAAFLNARTSNRFSRSVTYARRSVNVPVSDEQLATSSVRPMAKSRPSNPRAAKDWDG